MYKYIYNIYTKYFILIFICDYFRNLTFKKKCFKWKLSLNQLVLRHSEQYLLNVRRFLLYVFQNHSKLFMICD